VEITFLAERAASPGKTEPRFVVVDDSYRLHAEASAYLAARRGLDRSPNTERVYAGWLALFLSYCAASRISW